MIRHDPHGDAVGTAIRRLPPLPSLVRYWDDFSSCERVIRSPETVEEWLFHFDGQAERFDFEYFDSGFRQLIKHCAVLLLSARQARTVLGYLSALRALNGGTRDALLANIVSLHPGEFRVYWNNSLLPELVRGQDRAIRALLRTACALRFGLWEPDLSGFVSKLPGVPYDKYAVVRTGECFLPLAAQSQIVQHIDRLAEACSRRQPPSLDILEGGGVLVLAFQYGFRPGQIARVTFGDIKLHSTGAVHVSVPLIKKRNAESRRRVVRSIKRDWCPIFVELLRGDEVGHRLLFGMTPHEISCEIRELTEELTGSPWSGTDLRHTAAQRLADAGVSHAALTEFLTHSDLRTANVYYDASASQADRLNKALGLSKIYGPAAEAFRTRCIDKVALLQRPQETIISAAPHGIPISGIGSCTSAQSLCPKSPVMSCYTCHKFMPLNEPAVHETVLRELRTVVLAFSSASPGGEAAPAMMQLRSTLAAAQRLVNELEGVETRA